MSKDKPKLKFNMRNAFEKKVSDEINLTKRADPQKEREKEIRIVPTNGQTEIEENVLEEEEKVLAQEPVKVPVPASPKINLSRKTKPPVKAKDTKLKIAKPKHKLSLAEMIDKELPAVEFMTVDDIKEQVIWVIEGEKSGSKTASALSFPGDGKKLVIAFEQKAGVVWKEMYGSDPDIQIIDCSRFIKKNDELTYLQTSTMAVAYAQKTLEEIQGRKDIDWIVIDGAKWWAKYSEYAMRYQFNFGLTQPFDWQFWNWRNMYFESIQDQALNVANRGIIYTLYPFKPEAREIEDKKTGEKTVVVSKPPAWRNDLLKDVDNIIRVWSEMPKQEGALPSFYLETVLMKRGFVNGIKVDITSAFDPQTKRLNPSRAYDLLYEKASLENYQVN